MAKRKVISHGTTVTCEDCKSVGEIIEEHNPLSEGTHGQTSKKLYEVSGRDILCHKCYGTLQTYFQVYD